MISRSATFALALIMAAAQPALAARIYNYLPVPVHVRGSHEGSVTVGPGNYLLIGHEGLSIYCELCDSDHKLMHSSSGRAPQEIAKELQGKSGDHSC